MREDQTVNGTLVLNKRKSENDPTAPSALTDPGLVLVRDPDRPDL